MNDFVTVIIDDDIWMQRILSKVMEGFGFTTYIASNGYDGVALAVEHRPMLIFLDIMMPELSGHLTLKMLKRIKLTKDIPVVMITALSDTENLGMAVKMGAVGFVSKPFTRATIFDKLRNIIGAETLNMIAKRAQMESSQSASTPVAPQQNYNNANDYGVPNMGYNSDFGKDSFGGSGVNEMPGRADRQTSPDASKRYQDESNQRQIDAIKELLLKEK